MKTASTRVAARQPPSPATHRPIGTPRTVASKVPPSTASARPRPSGGTSAAAVAPGTNRPAHSASTTRVAASMAMPGLAAEGRLARAQPTRLPISSGRRGQLAVTLVTSGDPAA